MKEEPSKQPVPPISKPQAQISVRTYLICVATLVALSSGTLVMEKILRPISVKVCTTENVVIPQESRHHTSYKLDTSCGQLVMDDSIAQEANRTIKRQTTYRMVIASGLLAEFLMELPVEVQP